MAQKDTALKKLKQLTPASKYEIIVFAFTVIIFTSIVFFFSRRVGRALSDNLTESVVMEFTAMADNQAELTEAELQENFVPLLYVADCLENGVPFNSDIIKAVAEINNWKTLGIADSYGTATSCYGHSLGNVVWRKYFITVKSGRSDRFIEYLPDTNLKSGARLVFSVPYKNGVLFASMDTAELERFIPNTSYVYFIDSDCRILGPDENVSDDSFFEEHKDFLKGEMALNNSGVHTGKDDIMIYRPTGINDWYIIAVANMTEMESLYAPGMRSIRRVVNWIWASLAVMLLFMLGSFGVFLSEISRREKATVFEKRKNDILLRESRREQYVYDVGAGTVTGGGPVFRKRSIKAPRELNAIIREFRKIYPGNTDYLNEVSEAIYTVARTAETKSIEHPVSFRGGYHWIRAVYAPYTESGRKVTHVLISLADISYMHSEFEKNVSMVANMPGGLRRSNLSRPAHVEYLSPGLCRLTGYSQAEIDERIKGNYPLLIHEEDRPVYRDFINNLTEKPGIGTCEYRIICRDGKAVTVSDTMESVMAENGVMYGYSVVTDISEITAELKAARQQIEESRERSRRLAEELKDARVRNSVSQMQPHFLYNALSSIREIVLDDPEYASDLICDFTVHLRACVKSMSSNALVPFAEELENVKAYVNIEKMRFGERLSVKYDIACDDFMIVPLSVQPLVENAIRHGVFERGKAGGSVCVSETETEEQHILTVEDDGVGFDYEKMMGEIERGERDSTGLVNTKFRLEKMLGAKVEIESRTGKGTRITIRIPNGGGENAG